MTVSRERLVVIGGDAAGMTAASQARRLRPDVDGEHPADGNHPLDILVLERSPHTSYSA